MLAKSLALALGNPVGGAVGVVICACCGVFNGHAQVVKLWRFTLQVEQWNNMEQWNI